MAWFGLVAPGRTPRPIIARLNAETVKALNEPELQNRFSELGARLAGNSPAAFDAYIKAERVKWAKIVRDANIKLN